MIDAATPVDGPEWNDAAIPTDGSEWYEGKIPADGPELYKNELRWTSSGGRDWGGSSVGAPPIFLVALDKPPHFFLPF